MKKIETNQPTRRMVETLLKELSREFSRYYGNCPNATRLNEMKDKMWEELKSSRKYIAIERKLEVIIDDVKRRNDEGTKKVDKVRRMYLANGVTPTVLKALNSLVDLLEQ